MKTLHLLFDYARDESYTPSSIEVLVGSSPQSLCLSKALALKRPVGWLSVPLGRRGDAPKVWVLQVKILDNHMSGKDSHLRQLRVFAPVQELGGGEAWAGPDDDSTDEAEEEAEGRESDERALRTPPAPTLPTAREGGAYASAR